MTRNILALGVALALSAATTAQAAEAGDWVLRVGAHQVAPKSNNGHLAAGAFKTDVGNNVRPTFALEYMFTPNWGLEVLAALPFEHEVSLNGVKSADVKHLPPTVSVQYHFLPGAKFSPFVGVGLNYTRFFGIDETGPLEGTQLNLSDSWGAALHLGFDVAIDDRWLFTADARWIDIETDARLDGAGIGSVKIDPIVWGVAVGYRF
mgnify:CR=1 FL=1